MKKQRINNQTELIRVLQCTGALNMGGAETMIMNVYREIDKSKIQFDFVVAGDEIGYYENEATTLGAHIHHITKRSESVYKHLKELCAVVKKGQYKIAHFHTQNAFLSSIEIMAAKLAGVKCIVVHSHNTTDWRTGMTLKLHSVFRPVLNFMSDVRLACGEDAGVWLYGSEKGFRVVPLPVSCDKYRYSEEKYALLREKYGVTNRKVYSHTGRFSDQKNHEFLIDVFSEIVKRDSSSILFLMGDGELRTPIEEKVEQLGITGNVVFCGNVNDVNDKLLMSDAFLLPSKFEGFPTVVLEAQAAGLPCYISDTITEKIAVTELVKQISLQMNAEQWSQQIISDMNETHMDRQQANAEIHDLYDTSIVTGIFESIYKSAL